MSRKSRGDAGNTAQNPLWDLVASLGAEPAAEAATEEVSTGTTAESTAAQPKPAVPKTAGEPPTVTDPEPTNAQPVLTRTNLQPTKGRPKQTGRALKPAEIKKPGLIATPREPAKAKREKPKAHGVKQILLRVPEKVVKELDRALKARSVKTTRHRWIVEAIDHQARFELSRKP